MIYIYTLSHPITKEIRYVGKTVNPKQRRHNHSNVARDKGTYKRNWINSLKKQDLRPLFEIIDIVEDDWKFWERYWIVQCKVWGFKLCNHTEGGDGLSMANSTSFKSGQKSWNSGKGDIIKLCTKCTKEFTSKRHLNKSFCSKNCRYSFIAAQKVTTRFKTDSIPWNKRIKGYTTSKSKAIQQLDSQGNIIAEFFNCQQAANYFNCNSENIRNAISGRSKSAVGFKWKYK